MTVHLENKDDEEPNTFHCYVYSNSNPGALFVLDAYVMYESLLMSDVGNDQDSPLHPIYGN